MSGSSLGRLRVVSRWNWGGHQGRFKGRNLKKSTFSKNTKKVRFSNSIREQLTNKKVLAGCEHFWILDASERILDGVPPIGRRKAAIGY